MIKICRRKSNRAYVVVELIKGEYVSGPDHDLLSNAQAELKRKQRNAQKRAENEILRDMCGTSAAAARRDMGL